MAGRVAWLLTSHTDEHREPEALISMDLTSQFEHHVRPFRSRPSRPFLSHAKPGCLPDKMALAQQLGQGVQMLRKTKEMTQAQVAEAVGVSSDEISRIERGAREPRFDTIERLAEALGVDARDLFSSGSESAATTARPKRNSPVARMEATLEGLDPSLADAILRCARILAGAVEKRR